MPTTISKAEDDSIYEIEVITPRLTEAKAPESDQFKVKGDAKSHTGLSSNFKRKISKRYSGLEDSSTKQIEVEGFSGYDMYQAEVPPHNISYLAQLYDLSPVHHAAVGAKVANVIGLGFNLIETSKTKARYDELSDDEKALVKARKKAQKQKVELEDFLDKVNEEDDFIEGLSKSFTDYETTGNGYIEIGRTRDGTIGYIGHIPSLTMRVRSTRDGFVQMVGAKVRFFRNFGDQKTSNPFGNDDNPNEVIHLKKYSPGNSFYGVPDIMSASNAVAGNELAGRFNLDYFENKAIPRHLILMKGVKLSDKSYEAVMNMFEAKLKGKHHRSVVVPIPADLDTKKYDFKIIPIEANVQDSSFTEYRKANVSDILMAHRVPISKISMSESASLALAKDADKTFKEQVCQPEQRKWEKKINKIIAELTNVFVLKFNELTLTDADMQSQIDERMVRNDIIRRNEIRARLGLPALVGGDEKFEPTSQVAADQKATAQQSRARDANRSAGQTDGVGAARNPKGEGRATA